MDKCDLSITTFRLHLHDLPFILILDSLGLCLGEKGCISFSFGYASEIIKLKCNNCLKNLKKFTYLYDNYS
ncbi:hypothetical protein COLO4_10478 [Corchorus olitorius]|uniref:Uncharacterized protein n=1 Tax=Corchorus olitorius TaxID=93759 RepID=A0A1R3K8B3_9ROSI|nr:hypothetical protein COLO4_10478 [Corchorus olitorius]